MDIDTLQGLRRCPLFNGLTESEIIDLMHKVRYRVVRCCKGEFHAIEGSVCQYADIIIQGEMVASMMGPSGRIIRVADHQSGKLLAPAFFFASDNQYPVTVEATTDTTVFRLMPADLEKILSHDPRLMMNYIKILSNVVSHLTKKVRMLSMSVREKVILYLEEQIRLQQSKDVLLPFSRQELADHFGIQKYSLQRCLNELKQEGAILVEGRHVKVLSCHPSGGTARHT
jgi:CRP-like cAMP-binding protein